MNEKKSTDPVIKTVVFQGREVRKQLVDGEWWYVPADVVVALTGTKDPKDYLKRLRRRDEDLKALLTPGPKKAGEIRHAELLRFGTKGGRQYILSWNTAGILRLLQTVVRCKKVPAFTRWITHK